MPELPEVEAVRRQLDSQGLVGRRVTGVELLWPRAVRMPSEEEFSSDVVGRRILRIRRRAKYLVLELGRRPRRALLLHLGMTGSLVVQQSGLERPRHTRNTLILDGGLELCFVDPRKLGAIWLVKDESEVLAKLGPEPMDSAFTADALAERLSYRDVPVKALLCDQAIVAGIGNIYADEVLFIAGIHPLKRSRSMSANHMERLHEAIVRRLTEATRALPPYASGWGPATESHEESGSLLLLRSEGAHCGRCGTSVSRVKVRGRTSYFCARCQKI